MGVSGSKKSGRRESNDVVELLAFDLGVLLRLVGGFVTIMMLPKSSSDVTRTAGFPCEDAVDLRLLLRLLLLFGILSD